MREKKKDQITSVPAFHCVSSSALECRQLKMPQGRASGSPRLLMHVERGGISLPRTGTRTESPLRLAVPGLSSATYNDPSPAYNVLRLPNSAMGERDSIKKGGDRCQPATYRRWEASGRHWRSVAHGHWQSQHERG